MSNWHVKVRVIPFEIIINLNHRKVHFQTKIYSLHNIFKKFQIMVSQWILYKTPQELSPKHLKFPKASCRRTETSTRDCLAINVKLLLKMKMNLSFFNATQRIHQSINKLNECRLIHTYLLSLSKIMFLLYPVFYLCA